MTRTKRILGALAACFMTAMIVACGAMGNAAARQRAMNDLKQFGLAYHMYLDANSKPPANEKEFTAWVSAKEPEAAPVIAKVLAQGYRVYWGTHPGKLTAGSGNTILIYPADASAKGGLVVFADGSVRQVTNDEFDAAAKPTPPAPK